MDGFCLFPPEREPWEEGNGPGTAFPRGTGFSPARSNRRAKAPPPHRLPGWTGIFPAKIPAVACFTISFGQVRVKGGRVAVHWKSMVCPECKAEYLEGVHVCPDCRIPLVQELSPQPLPEYVEYVTVLKTGNPVVLAMVKSLLSAAGIRHFVKGGGLQDLFC